MPTKRPSFLKRQKEQKRVARAQEKRETRRARKEAKSVGVPVAETPDYSEENNAAEDMAPSEDAEL